MIVWVYKTMWAVSAGRKSLGPEDILLKASSLLEESYWVTGMEGTYVHVFREQRRCCIYKELAMHLCVK